MSLKRFGCTVTACAIVLGAAVFPTGESSVLPMTAKVEAANVSGNFQYERNDDGSITLTKYMGSGNASVKCPDKIGTMSVTAFGDGLFKDHTEIKYLTVPEGLVTIGDHAFSGCTQLTDQQWPDSVTTIGSYAFEECDALYEVKLPKGLKKLSEYTFKNCDKVKYINLPEDIEEIELNAFEGCSSLDSLSASYTGKYYYSDIYKGLHHNGELIFFPPSYSRTSYSISSPIGKGACEGCVNLESVIFNYQVTYIGSRAFYGCTGIEEITIPDETERIGEKAFIGCKGLKKVTFEGMDTVIEDNAFERSNRTGIKFYCYSGSTAHAYAKRNMISFHLLDGDGSSIVLNYNTDNTDLIPSADSVIFEGPKNILTQSNGRVIKLPESISDGNYKITFGSTNGAFTPRSYNVTVKNGKVTEPFSAVLNLKGDINGDKKLNASDLLKAKSHIKGVARLDGYEFDCANIDRNTVINASDLLKMKSHIKGVSNLWK
ncbi:MAG: leucine-rich repeat protein [Ruminococcus sp.]|nr:leucine-rich repeat protein [Ruminococcus sp.]